MTRHFLIAGAQRCGTTYLFDLLEAHPDVVMAHPARPEPKFFLDDHALDEGLAGYHGRFFAHAGTEARWGEKSTSYLEFATVPARVRAVLGEIDVVVMVRDPVARAVSHWRYSTRHGYETRPLAAVLEDNLAGPLPWAGPPPSVSPVAYLERGRYADYLPAWTALPLHVHFLEDVAHRASARDAVFRGLGVEPLTESDSSGSRAAHDAVNASPGDSPELPGDLVRALRDYFCDSDAELARMLGRELPWPSRHGGSGLQDPVDGAPARDEAAEDEER